MIVFLFFINPRPSHLLYTDGSSHAWGKITYIGSGTMHDTAHALVEWTWRRALHCRIWDKHVVSSGLSTTVVWFSSKKSGRWRRKVTERPPCCASEGCRMAKFSLTHDAVQTPSTSMWFAARDRPVAFMYSAVQTPSASIDLSHNCARDPEKNRANASVGQKIWREPRISSLFVWRNKRLRPCRLRFSGYSCAGLPIFQLRIARMSGQS